MEPVKVLGYLSLINLLGGIVVQASAWRRKFTALAEDVFRELGFEAPAMLYEDNIPLAMELEVEGMPFELLHSASDQPTRLVVICKLGPLPADEMAGGLKRLLHVNLILARCHEAVYGVDPEYKNILCMFNKSLETCTATNLLSEMRQISNDSFQWKDDFFSDSLSSASVNNDPGSLALA